VKSKEFGSRLRELREGAGLSQRELADRVEINFTYLSKIENGVMPPPSEGVILKLVEVLNTDRDELLTLGGKVPSDLVQILENREVLQSLREGRTQKKSGVANKRNGFGERLKELREKTGLGQGELAGRVGVNFTYLSKIESGTKPAPSEKVILKLAEVLDCDKDELLSSAGKVPSDIAQLLKNGEVMQSLRKASTQKTMNVANSGKGVSIMKHLLNGKNLARLALPFILVIGVAASLWFSSPSSVKALLIEITDPQGQPLEAGTLGSVYNFSVNVTIADGELLPIQNVNLTLFNSANSIYSANLTELPLVDGGTANYTNNQSGGGGTVNITAAAPDFGSLYGYGYVIWQGYTYQFNLPTGYGYGYGATGASSISYNIAWTPPSAWPVGTYQIQADITTSLKTFTQTAAFTINAAPEVSPPDLGGGLPPSTGTGAAPVSGNTDVSSVVTSDGVFPQDVTANSADGKVELAIEKDVKGLTKEGDPIATISVVAVSHPGAPPANASIIGLTYDLGPDEATFDPPIALTFAYNPAALPDDVAESELSISYWDGTRWLALESTVDTAVNTVTTKISHLSKYAVIGRPAATPPPPSPPAAAPAAPAAFATSDLTVSPAQVNIGETVTITVSVANTGGKEGSYTAVLNINGVKEAEKSLAIAGGDSKIATFSVSRQESGSYSVAVNDLSATFTVVAPPVKPPVVPPVVEPPAEVPVTPTNWGLIGGIIAAVIVIGVLVYFFWWRRRPA
jgi:transcriptional regulator with XRE-family HTH domain